jgi:hypothetical protein
MYFYSKTPGQPFVLVSLLASSLCLLLLPLLSVILSNILAYNEFILRVERVR